MTVMIRSQIHRNSETPDGLQQPVVAMPARDGSRYAPKIRGRDGIRAGRAPTDEQDFGELCRMTRILECLPAGVVVLDGAGLVQRCNPAAEELLGIPLQGEVWRQVISRAFAPRVDDGHEVSLRDGRRVSIATRSLGDEPGQVLLIKDVTETRRLQDRLNHRDRLLALGEMTAALAHQIRTPLSTALLYGSQMTDESISSVDCQRFARKLLAPLRHLERLVKHMLLFARGEGLVGEYIDLASLLRDFQGSMDSHFSQAGARLIVVNASPGAAIMGNRDALLTALQNLAGNALQACGKDCELVVRLCTLKPSAEHDIVVIDNGPGVAEDLKESIFEPFFTTRNHGTGLGLAVVKAIVKAHEGAVWVESEAGAGSRFTLRFPAAPSRGQVNMGNGLGVSA